jgi:hypothetical protein
MLELLGFRAMETHLQIIALSLESGESRVNGYQE